MFFQAVASIALTCLIFFGLNKLVWCIYSKYILGKTNKTIKDKQEELCDLKEEVTELTEEIDVTEKLDKVEDNVYVKKEELHQLDKKREERGGKSRDSK